MNSLFDPLVIRETIFHNRVWVSPMCQYSATDGFVGQWHSAHLDSFSTGAPGMVMVEATGVVPEGRISIACPSIHTREHAESFRPMIDFAHSQNVRMGIQLAHAGRKGSTMRPWDDHRMASVAEGGWECVSSSAIAFHGYPVPRALSINEIHQLRDDFVAAAMRALEVGFDVLEIHAAHGYLFHQFYSPLANSRTDEYGGSFENRIRFLLETASAIRAAIPESVPLFVRISATDWVDDGWNLIDSIELCARLKEVGVDLIDVSTGGNVHDAPITATPGFQVPFAAAIRNEANILTTAVGLITEPEQAQYIIEVGEADAVFLARAMIRNPRWALNAAEKLGVVIEWPKQFDRGRTLP